MAKNGHIETIDGIQGQCIRGPLKPALTWKAKCADEIVEAWYKEGAKYKYGTDDANEKTRQFTQLVWHDTTSVGMALSQDGKYAVANFYIQGNTPEWNLPWCVGAPQKKPAPWRVATEAPPSDWPPLCAKNWELHDELEENMRKAANLRQAVDENE